MTSFTGSDDDKKDKPEEIAERLGVLGYLERRAERMIESRQAIVRIVGAIRDTMLDIANLLAGNPSAGGQAELERVVGSLQGLTKAADQASAALSGGGDSGASRGAEVDLTGIKTAVEARRENAGQTTAEGTLENLEGKTRKGSAKAKALSTLDAAMAVGEDQTVAKNSDASAPSDGKLPVSDAPVSKADRFKLAFANSDSKADPLPSASSDLPLLVTSPNARPNAALLRLEHADAVHTDPASKGDVSASGGAAIEPPKEDAPKARQGAIQSADASRKPAVLAVT